MPVRKTNKQTKNPKKAKAFSTLESFFCISEAFSTLPIDLIPWLMGLHWNWKMTTYCSEGINFLVKGLA
jgi:hypothetical protein